MSKVFPPLASFHISYSFMHIISLLQHFFLKFFQQSLNFTIQTIPVWLWSNSLLQFFHLPPLLLNPPKSPQSKTNQVTFLSYRLNAVNRRVTSDTLKQDKTQNKYHQKMESIPASPSHFWWQNQSPLFLSWGWEWICGSVTHMRSTQTQSCCQRGSLLLSLTAMGTQPCPLPQLQHSFIHVFGKLS